MSISSLSLEGKVAIVTGGGTGIGRSIALEFARAGADVVVASRRLSVLEKVGEEVRALGRRSLAVQTDVSQKADVDNLVQKVLDEFGIIDILVNNAGIGSGGIDTPEEQWHRVIGVNLTGCYLCSQAVGDVMVEQKKGNIINIASVAGIRAGGTSKPYSISKAGVIMLTRVLARQLGPNIRVNCIAPGAVKTELVRFLWSNPDRMKELEARVPLGRIAEPEEMATVALFLASEASSYITGHTIVADGGSSA